MESEEIFQWDERYPTMDIIDNDHNKETLYVYKIDNEVIGVISFDEEQPEEYSLINWCNHENNSIVIHRLAVHPRYQGRGIARQRMSFAEQTASHSGYESARLDAYSGNERAIKFYIKSGYQIRGQTFFPRRELPFYCMEKQLIF